MRYIESSTAGPDEGFFSRLLVGIGFDYFELSMGKRLQFAQRRWASKNLEL